MKETVAAHAAETAEHATGGMNAILQSADTWVLAAFVIFIALFALKLWPKLAKGLDARADKIRDQLEQASRLRAEAEALLASYKSEQESLLKQAEEIVAHAKRDAADLRTRAGEELKLALDRRSQQAQEKIARAEAEAVEQIRVRIIESATEKARDIISEQLSGSNDDEAVSNAIAAIGQQIH